MGCIQAFAILQCPFSPKDPCNHAKIHIRSYGVDFSFYSACHAHKCKPTTPNRTLLYPFIFKGFDGQNWDLVAISWLFWTSILKKLSFTADYVKIAGVNLCAMATIIWKCHTFVLTTCNEDRLWQPNYTAHPRKAYSISHHHRIKRFLIFIQEKFYSLPKLALHRNFLYIFSTEFIDMSPFLLIHDKNCQFGIWRTY